MTVTTYVLGAGASAHAGYPLCVQLWPRLVTWVLQNETSDSELRRTIDSINTLNGPVGDIESVCTDLELNRGAFASLSDSECRRLQGGFRRLLRTYFKTIRHDDAPLYAGLAERLQQGDLVITFNYDLALENELAKKGKFKVRDGYGFSADWDEASSPITILKLHGSLNWIGNVFQGSRGGSSGYFSNSLGARPFVDNADSALVGYAPRVLDKSFPGGGVTDGSETLILPTYEKRFSVRTNVGDEWGAFFDGVWEKAIHRLQSSTKIVVIGYSLPAADRRARAMLLWNANKSARTFVCSGTSSEGLKLQFEDHGFWRVQSVGTFEEFLESP